MKITKEFPLEEIIKKMKQEGKTIGRIKLSLINSDRILEISKGEIKKAATILHRYEQPIEDGLLCEKIFGPIIDHTCKCNRYLSVKEEGIVCPECGVEAISSKNRYNRFGHINLNALVINPLFHDSIRTLLRLTVKEYNAIVYHGEQLFFKPAENSILVINNQSGKLVLKETDEAINMGTGVNAIKNVLLNINLDKIRDKLIEKNDSAHIKSFTDYKSRDKLYQIEDMIDNDFKLIDTVMSRLLVLPAGFRHEYWNGDTFIKDDLNQLYGLVIRRNNTVKKISETRTFSNIIINRHRGALQEAIDILYYGTTLHKKECKGLVKIYAGKEGRLRNNLLGKRTDYSGRSVIVPGVKLKIDEIGLPFKIILEIFKPLIIGYLRKTYTIGMRESERIWKLRDDRVFEAINHIAEKYRVIANRQPTLHRQSMMSYSIVPVSGEAIQLTPCVTDPYNADFDGDQMAIHQAFNSNSRDEIDTLMTPKHNLLLPLNSEPNIAPTQEQVYGLYYLTKEPSQDSNKGIFSNPDEAIAAYDIQKGYGDITLHSYVTTRIDGKIVKNTIGRLIFYSKTSIYITEPLNKKKIKKMLSNLYDTWSNEQYVKLIDVLKEIGFEYATISSVSFCLKDSFDDYCSEKRKELKGKKGRDAQIVIDAMKKHVATITNNPAVEMSICGARGNITQLSQLIASKGLQARADGSIVETPVINSLGEGLTETEFFLTVYGARKSLADKKMAVGDAGFIAHKLTKGCRDLIIDEDDCGSTLGIVISKELSFGRTILKDYGDSVLVRSPVTCLSKGICAKCYGLELGRRIPAQKGDAVGIIAAQSLTEPATQLVMRTFHCFQGVSLLLVKINGKKILKTFEELWNENANHVKHENGQEEKDIQVEIWDKDKWTNTTKIIRHKKQPDTEMVMTRTRDNKFIISQDNHPHMLSLNKGICKKCSQPFTKTKETGCWECPTCKKHPRKVTHKPSSEFKMVTPREIIKSKYFGFTSFPVWETENNDPDMDAYLVGFHLGDGRHEWENALPGNFNTYSDEYLSKCLCGIIDSDGSCIKNVTPNYISIEITSLKLIQQLSLIFDKFQIKHATTVCTIKDLTHHQAYVIKAFPDETHKHLFKDSLKFEGYTFKTEFHQKDRDGLITYTKEVLFDDNDYVYDLSTETGTLTVNGLWTHNTGGAVEKIEGLTKNSKKQGIVKLIDIIEGKTCVNNIVNFYSKNSRELTPRIQIINNEKVVQEEFISSNAKLHIVDGQNVNAEDTLFSGDVSNFDIASSLPELKALYDNSSKIIAYMSPCDGLIKKIEPHKTKPFLVISVNDKKVNVPKGIVLLVSVGDKVRKGDRLTAGNYDYNALIEIGGLKLSSEKFVEQGLKIYNDNGIKLLPIHLEVIYRALTSHKVLLEGTEPGKIVDRSDNRLGIPIVIGITQLIKYSGSMLKRASIGWVKNGFVSAITYNPFIGDCETDRIVLGALPLVGTGSNPNYLKNIKEKM